MARPKDESRNLDVLRAVATLFVIIFHLELVFQYMPHRLAFIGHWGVLMLFFHTSCVLMCSLRRQSGGQYLWLRFFLRRCFRIYPLTLIIVLGVYFFNVPVGHFERGMFVEVKLGAADLLSNILLLQDLTGTDSILATLWSLPYQMHMCMLLPLLRSVRFSHLYTLFGLWLASVVVAQMFPIAIYVPCLMGGVVAFQLSGLPVLQRWRLPYWATSVLIAVLTVGYMIYPGQLSGWIGCLVLGVTLPFCSEIPKGCLWRGFHIISRYSFGIYMTHFIALWVALRFFGDQKFGVQLAVITIFTGGASVLLYHLIEDPMNSLGKRLTSKLASPRIASQPAELREHTV